MKILVIGESCKDIYQYGKSYRLAPEAPVPVFQPYKTVINGGMAMNVYNNVKSLGAQVDIITNKNWETIEKERFVDEKTNQMFLRVDKNDNTYGVCDDSIFEIIEDYDAIIISDYDKGFLSNEIISKICKHHKKVFLDTKKILGSWCKNVKYIKINNLEYERTKHTISNDIKDKLIITMSRDGCKHQNVIYPVPEVQIKDSSGAGDTFISGLVVKYIQTSDISLSIKYANECATSVVQKRGVSTI